MTEQVPFEDKDGYCVACGRTRDATHRDDCVVAATIEWTKARVAGVPWASNDELTKWWLELARQEATKVVPKAIEYGATDLAEIGRQLVTAGVRVPTFPSRIEKDAFYAELGVYFYVLGKLARWTDAVATGRQVSDDTLHDIGVYVRMVQRIRAAGGWPGVELKNEESK